LWLLRRFVGWLGVGQQCRGDAFDVGALQVGQHVVNVVGHQ